MSDSKKNSKPVYRSKKNNQEFGKNGTDKKMNPQQDNRNRQQIREQVPPTNLQRDDQNEQRSNEQKQQMNQQEVNKGENTMSRTTNSDYMQSDNDSLSLKGLEKDECIFNKFGKMIGLSISTEVSSNDLRSLSHLLENMSNRLFNQVPVKDDVSALQNHIDSKFIDISNVLNKEIVSSRHTANDIIELKNQHIARILDKINRSESVQRELRSKVEAINVDVKAAESSIVRTVQNENGKLASKQKATDEFIDGQFQVVSKMVKNMSNDLETTLGQTRSISEQVENINAVLSDKNLVMRQKLPSSNHDEETLSMLSEYGHTILEQLTTAARWYARNRSDIENIQAERKQHMEELLTARNKARDEGAIAGRQELVRDLINKFNGIDSLMNPSAKNAVSYVKIIADFLENEGVQRLYDIGEELEIDDANRQQYEGKIENIMLGKVRIINPGYQFADMLLSKATCEEIKLPEIEVEDVVAVEDNPTGTSEDSEEKELVTIEDENKPESIAPLASETDDDVHPDSAESKSEQPILPGSQEARPESKSDNQ